MAVFSRQIGDLLTGSLPPSAAHIAARALVVLVPAAFLQLLAALAASALAALDSYGIAAGGFALGGIVGLVVFAALAGSTGSSRSRWGLGVNASSRLRSPSSRSAPQRAWRAAGRPARHRPAASVSPQGAAVPVALQGCYLLGLRFAAQLGVGRVTSFSYAYLAASTLVGATAFSVGAHLLRAADPPRHRRLAAGRHVVHAAWVSLSIVGAAAGVFALVGGRIVGVVLGNAYRGGVGRSSAISSCISRPGCSRGWLRGDVPARLRRREAVDARAARLAGFAVCIPLGLGLRAAWGLPGIAVAVGLATLVISVGLMAALSTCRRSPSPRSASRGSRWRSAPRRRSRSARSRSRCPRPRRVAGVARLRVVIVAHALARPERSVDVRAGAA